MSISSILNQIENGDIVLPAIQRSFVWSEEKIVMLFDSIMREYPIGIVLMWETYDDIQFRKFEKQYEENDTYRYEENYNKKRLRVVLDGQQRLQSLYIGLYGELDKRSLYFDVLCDHSIGGILADEYGFEFATNKEVNHWNNEVIKRIKKTNASEIDDAELYWYEKFKDLYDMSSTEKLKLIENISGKLNLNDKNKLILNRNLMLLNQVFAKDENILATLIVDEDEPIKSEDRKSMSEVVELFVRINTQGVSLNRSDIIFSFLKLEWKESTIALPEFVEDINKGNSFELDNDFVIRCLFTVSGFGSKLDIDKLRDKGNVEIIKNNFNDCCASIRSTLDFIHDKCWCISSKALGGYNTLIPFVYYLFNINTHIVPDSELDNFRKSLYLFGFTKALNRYGDYRVSKFSYSEMEKNSNKKIFPLRGTVKWLKTWEGFDNFNSEVIQINPLLALNLLQGYRGGRKHYEANKLEIDHIFPRSKLRTKRYEPYEVNHFANLWLLPSYKNKNKSNKDPEIFFADVNKDDLSRAKIDRHMLKYRKYRKFLELRRDGIVEYVKRMLKYSDDDFVI